MAWTQAQVDILEAAIFSLASGAVQEITFAEQTYTFIDLQKLYSLLSTMKHDLAVAAGKGYRLAATAKGV